MDVETHETSRKKIEFLFSTMRFIIIFITAVRVLFLVKCLAYNAYPLSLTVFLGSAVTKTFYTYVHVYFSLGFSEITECEKNGLVCPPEMVCKTENGKHRCACKDGYEEILLGAGNSTCRGSKTMSR